MCSETRSPTSPSLPPSRSVSICSLPRSYTLRLYSAPARNPRPVRPSLFSPAERCTRTRSPPGASAPSTTALTATSPPARGPAVVSVTRCPRGKCTPPLLLLSPLPSRLRLHLLDLLAADVYRLENLPCPGLPVRGFPVVFKSLTVRIGVSVRNRVKDPLSCVGVCLRTADADIRLGRGFWLIGRRRCLKLGCSVRPSTCTRAVWIGYVLISGFVWCIICIIACCALEDDDFVLCVMFSLQFFFC